jgi:penicillin-binding protein 1A
MEVGAKAVVQTAQRLGITSPLQANASIALGTSEVSPIELVGAYAAFANGGTGVVPYVIAGVKTGDGRVLYTRREGGLGRVIEPSAVSMMNDMMRETVLAGTARKAEIPGWEVAGKTGTSQDWRDAWFIGYTGSLVTGIWLGNDDGTPTKKVSGGNLPVEIWARYMKGALAGTNPVPLPGSNGWRPPGDNPRVASVNRTGSLGRAPEPAASPADGLTGFLSHLFGQ